MVRVSLTVLVAAAALSGCGRGTDSGPPLGNFDTRIDGAPKESDPDSHDTHLCVNESGQIGVVWVDDRDGANDVWFNRSLDLGNSWLIAPVKLNRGLNSKVWNPTIACNDKGVYVAWEDDRDGELQNHNIYFNRSTDGGETWAEADVLLELDDEGRSFSQGPQIASAGDDLYVVWYDNLNGAADIMCAASDDNGKTWREPVRVDSDEPPGIAFSGVPKITATATGNVYVVWEDTRNGNSDIYFARSDNAGNSFRPDTRLDVGDEAGENFSFSPIISADGENVYVVWHDARGGGGSGSGRDVYLNYSDDAGANWFNSAKRVEMDAVAFGNSIFPKVVTTGSIGTVAWSDYRDVPYDIYYRRYDGGEPIMDEARVDLGSDLGFANSTDVVMSTNGTEVIIAYEDGRDGNPEDESGYNDLYYNYVAGGAVQDPDLRIDTFYPANSFKTDLEVVLYQQLVFATWTDGREGTADVFFKKLNLGDAGETLEGEQANQQ